MSKAEVDDLQEQTKLCTDTAVMYQRYISEVEFGEAGGGGEGVGKNGG